MIQPFIADSSIMVFSDGSPKRISAIDFWNYYEKTGNSCGLEVYGMAKILLKLVVKDKTISLEIKLISDNLQINVFSLESLDDYIIYNNAWIPIDLDQVQELKNLLGRNEIYNYSELSLSSALTLTLECKKLSIEIRYSQNDLNLYLPKKTRRLETDISKKLFPYQRTGVNWLVGLHDEGIGGLLCDEMGLGKTIQALALIAETFDVNKSKYLIVCPSSLVINWEREFKKFLPNLSVYVHVGGEREGRLDRIDKPGLVLTSYELLTRDLGILKKIKWDVAIFDESQLLKNRNSQRSQAALEVYSKRKFLLTGTPVENSLRDLWTLSNIVREGMLGSFNSFESLIDDNPSDAKKLGRHIAPLILRRVVRDVHTELPELLEIEEPIIPTELFAQTYEEQREKFSRHFSNGNMLTLITHLTQLSCYPGLLIPDYVDSKDSKLIRLLEILTEVRRNQEKVIIFSTFQNSIDLLKQLIEDRFQNSFVKIVDGRIEKDERYQILDKFASQEGFAVLVINPKAGGVGLNITAANHVIHFNRQWNPQVERQATFRAYRHGQTRTVFVHKMFYMGTIEEVINDRQEFKEELAEFALEDSIVDSMHKDIERAIRISPIQLIRLQGE